MAARASLTASQNASVSSSSGSSSDEEPVVKLSDEARIKQMWDREEALTLEARRKRYACGPDFLPVDQVPLWESYVNEKHLQVNPNDGVFPFNQEINQRISLWPGNIVRLEIDGIQNAANKSMLGGGGIDGAIHSAAGDALYSECRLHHGCETGQTKITRGYDLPSKYVLHTVGPIGENAEALHSCYITTLDTAVKHGLRTVALCGVSTGIYGYPGEAATKVALNAVRTWLQTGDNLRKLDRIVFCIFTPQLLAAYEHHMPRYFPPSPTPVEVTLVWPHGGYRVQIAGEFNRWSQVDTFYDEKDRLHLFKVKLLPGVEHPYKWIIDGEWKYDGTKPICRDSMGNVNNFIVL